MVLCGGVGAAGEVELLANASGTVLQCNPGVISCRLLLMLMLPFCYINLNAVASSWHPGELVLSLPYLWSYDYLKCCGYATAE
jgi:hypothetical protein